MGVCRIAEGEGRAVDFGDLVPSGCVLRRLSEELFDLVFPALDTWRIVKGLMATERNSWSSIHFEDLPEGLSDRGGIAVCQMRPRRSRVRPRLPGLATLGLRGVTCPR